MPAEEGKRCSSCRTIRPIGDFAGRRVSTDGRQNMCRACTSDYARRTRPRKLAEAPVVPPGDKWCRRCEVVKRLGDFPKHRSTHDRRQTYCRECFSAIYRERRAQAGLVTRPADVPPGHKFCRGCERVKPASDWAPRPRATDGLHFRCRECISRRDRERHLAATYGLSAADVTELLGRQNGNCAICLRRPAVHVDHDHASGAVRGMLCFQCNAGLGQLEDRPNTLRRAADYLEGRKLVITITQPGVAQITYPDPPDPTPASVSFGPPRPSLDVRALREMASRG